MKLKIQTRMVYGRPLHYPMCDSSKLLVRLNRRTVSAEHTFSFVDRDLIILKQLGYEIEQIPQFIEVKDGTIN